ncbi:MAG: TIM barrel protein, partial [Oscillospiraceae bacterium]|nr:TIM barrel protein [Oscillospiraceae bacterium]
MKFRLAAFADEADGRISEQIKAMKDNGVDFLEIRGVDGQNISEITLQKAKEVRKQLDDAELGVWSLGSPYGKTGMGDGFEEHLDYFRRGLEIADILGAKHIRMFSFYVPSGEQEKYKDEVFRRLGCFIEAAKNSDVILCHENEKGIYGDIADRCAEIHKEFPS